MFRQQRSVLIAALTRWLGPANLDLIESAVQDAFVQAMQTWPQGGIPDNPPAWLMTVAKNRARDMLRKDAPLRHGEQGPDSASPDLPDQAPPSASLPGEVADDDLRMLFVACHPALTLEAQLVLTLRTLCGMELGEIARALLTAEATVAKRLLRAKQKLREVLAEFTVPAAAELSQRLDAVQRVLYLLFSEGYSSHQGDRLVREDLCAEAIRLASLLCEHPHTETPAGHALLALMLLHAARLRARTGLEGEPLTLREQDRGLWDQALIRQGLLHLSRSAAGDSLSQYHLEAAIAAAHASAPSYDRIDWARIVGLYDQLLWLTSSPVVALNRAVAIGMWRGPEAGAAEVAGVAREPQLRDYFPLHAARGHFLAESGQVEGARAAYEQALRLAGTEPERRLIGRRLAAL